MLELSPLQKARLQFQPQLPKSLEKIANVDFADGDSIKCDLEVRALFSHLASSKQLTITAKTSVADPIKVGVVLSGGQAAGGHNVIAGLFDALQNLHPESKLIGFLQGPAGIVKNEWREITKEYLVSYRNQGGFDIIGSGRTKIETKEQFEKAYQTVKAHNLDGLVVIGGDDSNTNAAFLAEFFLEKGLKTCVAGVPKTIDGDLQNEDIEIPFGFDSACKTYSECIGNIARDALSAKKYYYFIKLMGRSASHITLECALQCQPNLALIAEEAEANGWGLQDVVNEIVALVQARAKLGKEYGVILIPEGIIEFLPDMKALIQALNGLLAPTNPHARALEALQETSEKITYALKHIDPELQKTFQLLPQEIQLQLLLDRDPHGNVQVSKIETERLFIHMVGKVLKAQKLPFGAQPIFCGYEGRSCLPSNFDATYCYSLGVLAALLIQRKKTGYIVSLKNLTKDVSEWQPHVSPLVAMLHEEVREGKKKAVIQKALVTLDGAAFKAFACQREGWKLNDQYRQIGPIQFFGPKELTDSVPMSLISLQARESESS